MNKRLTLELITLFSFSCLVKTKYLLTLPTEQQLLEQIQQEWEKLEEK